MTSTRNLLMACLLAAAVLLTGYDTDTRPYPGTVVADDTGAGQPTGDDGTWCC